MPISVSARKLNCQLLLASVTDGAVVGSAVVDIIASNLADTPTQGVDADIVQKVATFVRKLAKAISE